MLIQLKYSAIAGQFRFALTDELANPLSDFKVLTRTLCYEKARDFVAKMYTRYPGVIARNQKEYPLVHIIKAELAEFLEDDVQQLKLREQVRILKRRAIYFGCSKS